MRPHASGSRPECRRRGRSALVAGCTKLILGDDSDIGLIVVLGGPSARTVLSTGPRDDMRHWLRVWGARGLLWAWDGTALEVVCLALRDEAWRVREMAAKIVARHLIGDALTDVAELRDDPCTESAPQPPEPSPASPTPAPDRPTPPDTKAKRHLL